jgi:hypothetical protein
MILGADPEVFVKKDGDLVSSIGIIEGTKDYPEDLGEGFYIQKDNILAEFNIPPSSSKEDFILNISKGVSLVRKYLKNHDLKVDISSFHNVPLDILKDREANMFGCDPDFIVWDGSERKIEITENVRTAGGHVHICYDGTITDKKSKEIVKACDIFLGIPSILIDPVKERRNYYGGAGCYRLKSYGVEYRTLSNFWISNKELISWVWDRVADAIKFVEDGNIIDESSHAQLIPDCINTSDEKLAKYYIKKYNIKLPKYAKVTV